MNIIPISYFQTRKKWETPYIVVCKLSNRHIGVIPEVSLGTSFSRLGMQPLQNHTGTYTGNMRSAMTKAGFKLLTDSKYLTSGDYLLPGDILLNDGHHRSGREQQYIPEHALEPPEAH